MSDQPPESQSRAGKKTRIGCMTCFFMPFVLNGFGMIFFMTIRPAYLVYQAQDWPEVPCEIVSSSVGVSHGDDSTTYSVQITYKYTIEGRQYQSDRYAFLGGYSSGSAGKHQIVNEHPPGHKTYCYVNPRDPAHAVLNRNFIPQMWIGLFGLIFLAVGAGGILNTVKPGIFKRKSKAKPVPMGPDGKPWPAWMVSAPETFGPTVLKPQRRLVGILIICLFWNGVVSIFVVGDVRLFLAGGGFEAWFMALFLVPFVGVGLVLIMATGHTILRLFTRHFILKVNTPCLAPGQKLETSWELASGRPESIRKMRLWLEGRELSGSDEAQSVGPEKETPKDEEDVFFKEYLVQTTQPSNIARGRATVEIPPQAMHSMPGAVAWTLRLVCEIPGFPDVNERYPMVVFPQAPREAAAADVLQTQVPWTQDQESSPLRLTTAGGRTDFRPGQTLAGTLTWTLPQKAISPMEVRLHWSVMCGTIGGGWRQIHTVHIESQEKAGSGEFQFALPVEGPWSFSGRATSLKWKVEAVAMWDNGQGKTIELPIVVAPGGRALDLFAGSGRRDS